MQEYQTRVIEERAQLAEKHDKLVVFIAGEVFDSLPLDEQKRLRRQISVMGEYLHILGERIVAFLLDV